MTQGAVHGFCFLLTIGLSLGQLNLIRLYSQVLNGEEQHQLQSVAVVIKLDYRCAPGKEMLNRHGFPLTHAFNWQTSSNDSLGVMKLSHAHKSGTVGIWQGQPQPS